jgi:transmembrane sensor
MRADFRTGAGQRHQVDLDGGGRVEMNTRTSLAYERAGDPSHVVLVAGEAVVTVPPRAGAPLEMIAAGGRTVADAARFSVRHLGSSVRVTGLDGEIQVGMSGQTLVLKAGSQVTYDHGGLGRPVEVDVALVTAWQRGLLIFRGTPLGVVVEEVNRYRPAGRIIVTDAALAQRPVNAIFHLDQIDGVVAQIEKMGARATHLPGDVVLLG